MKPSLGGLVPVFALMTATLWAQSSPAPQARLAYEDRTGTSGHTLVVDGRTAGPYRDVQSTAYSTSGTAVAFVVVKRDRLYVLAQGKETGPLPIGFDVDRLQVSDDGKFWALTATRASADEAEPAQTLLWVNGKSYGPYSELTTLEYAESGGTWIAAVRTAQDEADVLLSGKPQGPFYTVDHAWLTPDGKAWGYAVSDSEGASTVVTNEKTWAGVVEGNYTNLYPREPHWGYSLRFASDDQRIVVDGLAYEGYTGFQGLVLTPSGLHWAFEAQKQRDGDEVAIVLIDGKEYAGENLTWSRLGEQESYTWTLREGNKVSVQTLRLSGSSR